MADPPSVVGIWKYSHFIVYSKVSACQRPFPQCIGYICLSCCTAVRNAIGNQGKCTTGTVHRCWLTSLSRASLWRDLDFNVAIYPDAWLAAASASQHTLSAYWSPRIERLVVFDRSVLGFRGCGGQLQLGSLLQPSRLVFLFLQIFLVVRKLASEAAHHTDGPLGIWRGKGETLTVPWSVTSCSIRAKWQNHCKDVFSQSANCLVLRNICVGVVAYVFFKAALLLY